MRGGQYPKPPLYPKPTNYLCIWWISEAQMYLTQ
jgi:hypothetical protein